jgi:hypothetical protein
MTTVLVRLSKCSLAFYRGVRASMQEDIVAR